MAAERTTFHDQSANLYDGKLLIASAAACRPPCQHICKCNALANFVAVAVPAGAAHVSAADAHIAVSVAVAASIGHVACWQECQ